MQRPRAVTGRAVDADPAPADALLADGDPDALAGGGVLQDTAVLGDDVVAADGVALVLGEPPGAQRAAGLLVGDGEEQERAARPAPRRRQASRRHRHRGGEVEHVDGAPTPHHAVDELAAERVALPALGIDRHDVGVAHEHQGRGGRVGALEPGHQRRPPGQRLERLHLHAAAVEVVGEQLGAADLLARIRGAVVDAAVADQPLQQVGDLGGDLTHPRSMLAECGSGQDAAAAGSATIGACQLTSEPQPRRADLRNVAIVAHVDHGKTTLVDALLKQARVFAAHEQVGELIMDSNDLEREKGITILAKTTSIRYRGVKLNIIDTPGHADFGGEVERVLGMADGCLLLVDAAEGPMPQTRVVLRQALALGLRPIIVVNKIDRANARPAETVEATHDLLLELATDAAQLDAPVVYTNGREGTATLDLNREGAPSSRCSTPSSSTCPPPPADPDAPFQMLVSNLDHDNYSGRLALGRINKGVLRVGQAVVCCTADGHRPAPAHRHGADRRGPAAHRRSRRSRPARSSTSPASPRSPSVTPSPTPTTRCRCRAPRSASRRCACSSPSTSRRSPAARPR